MEDTLFRTEHSGTSPVEDPAQTAAGYPVDPLRTSGPLPLFRSMPGGVIPVNAVSIFGGFQTVVQITERGKIVCGEYLNTSARAGVSR